MAFSVQEKLGALAALERGERTKDIAQRMGVSEAAIYYWRKQHLAGESLETKAEKAAAQNDVDASGAEAEGAGVGGKQKQTRVKRSRELWQHIVDTYEAAPTQDRKDAVLTKHGVDRGNFYKWRQRLREEAAAKPARRESPQTSLVLSDAPPPMRALPASRDGELERLRLENARLKRMLKLAMFDEE